MIGESMSRAECIVQILRSASKKLRRGTISLAREFSIVSSVVECRFVAETLIGTENRIVVAYRILAVLISFLTSDSSLASVANWKRSRDRIHSESL